MTRFETVKLCARKTRDDSRFTKITLSCDGGDELAGHDVNLIPVFEGGVFVVRVKCDAEICGQRPWCCGPDHYKHVPPGECGIDECGIALKWKFNVDGRTRVLMIFNFGFGQRRLILETPVNRARTFV